METLLSLFRRALFSLRRAPSFTLLSDESCWCRLGAGDPTMTKLETLEHQIATLTPSELAEFRGCFEAYDAEVWDRQLEEDAKSGKLDSLAEAARRAFQAGR
jgi:hypothetical protein